ncbi:MAG: glycosyltransferase family 9 protein [Campylobacterales bacterium]|nr:glycosyltransferase family 9 protein [Campylobacterales bacterium]
MSLPILEAIKKRYPNCKTGFIVDKIAEGIGDNNPYIDEVFVFNKDSAWDVIKLIFKIRSKNYDISIDALGMPKTALMGLLVGAKQRIGIHKKMSRFYTELYEGGFDDAVYSAHHKLYITKLLDAFPKDKLPLPFINVPDSERAKHDNTFVKYDLERGEFFTSSPGSKFIHIQWMEERWAEVYDWLVEKYSKNLVILYAPSEEGFARKIYSKVRNKHRVVIDINFSSTKNLISFISMSFFHLTQNNGTKHLANCTGVPCLTLWECESTYHNWKIPSDEVVDNIIWAEDLRLAKPDFEGYCTELITVDIVKEEVNKILD